MLREWHLQGLPSDKTSVESAIAATTVATGRWPLLIDPQRQACRWLKHKGNYFQYEAVPKLQHDYSMFPKQQYCGKIPQPIGVQDGEMMFMLAPL